MLAYSKITHSVFILTLKALTILKVDLQVHLSGDAKVMHKNIHTPPPPPKKKIFIFLKKNQNLTFVALNNNNNNACVYIKKYRHCPTPTLWVFYAEVGWSETILVFFI